jgi:beta-glucosidase
MSRELAGRVDAWATLNEPWCSAFLGHGNGHHAPGLSDLRYATQAMHHLLLGHGLALRALHANDVAAKRGIVANVGAFTPATDSAADADAAHLGLTFHNQWVLDPLFKGTYPSDLFRLWPGTEPLSLDGDLPTIAQPLDFLGINYYFRTVVRADGKGGFVEAPPTGVERTAMGWEVYPQGLRDLLIGFKARYANLPPIYITENGMASEDHVVDGAVDDPQRAPPAGRQRSDRRRRRRARLFHLVTDGQLRVGLRLRPPLRHHLCRLRYAGAHAQEQRTCGARVPASAARALTSTHRSHETR